GRRLAAAQGKDDRGRWREDSEVDLRLPQPRPGVREDAVAEGGQLQTTAEAPPAYDSDEDPVEPLECPEQTVEGPQHLLDGPGAVLLDAHAVGEVAARPFEDDRLEGGRAPRGREFAVQIGECRDVEDVPGRRVENDAQDRSVVRPFQDDSILHGAGENWRGRRGSNPRPPACPAGVLTS